MNFILRAFIEAHDAIGRGAIAIANFINLKNHTGKAFLHTGFIFLYSFVQCIGNFNAIA
ncbi:MAG: hypothetical protein V7K55_07100 [Nostoc sp.]|uniref:hypothetical protein n=1 Tax=Nostoc sp. TaxID=1180 RepID=UPI002FF78F92